MKTNVGEIVMSWAVAMVVENIPPRQPPRNTTTTTPARSNVLNFWWSFHQPMSLSTLRQEKTTKRTRAKSRIDLAVQPYLHLHHGHPFASYNWAVLYRSLRNRHSWPVLKSEK